MQRKKLNKQKKSNLPGFFNQILFSLYYIETDMNGMFDLCILYTGACWFYDDYCSMYYYIYLNINSMAIGIIDFVKIGLLSWWFLLKITYFMLFFLMKKLISKLVFVYSV